MASKRIQKELQAGCLSQVKLDVVKPKQVFSCAPDVAGPAERSANVMQRWTLWR